MNIKFVVNVATIDDRIATEYGFDGITRCLTPRGGSPDQGSLKNTSSDSDEMRFVRRRALTLDPGVTDL